MALALVPCQHLSGPSPVSTSGISSTCTARSLNRRAISPFLPASLVSTTSGRIAACAAPARHRSAHSAYTRESPKNQPICTDYVQLGGVGISTSDAMAACQLCAASLHRVALDDAGCLPRTSSCFYERRSGRRAGTHQQGLNCRHGGATSMHINVDSARVGGSSQLSPRKECLQPMQVCAERQCRKELMDVVDLSVKDLEMLI